MGLSRRQFTKEFKLAAVRRLEQGVPVAEMARGMEVSPNVLHRWRKEFREGPGNAFSGNGNPRWSERPGSGTGTESRSADPGD
jgi:transposase